MAKIDSVKTALSLSNVIATLEKTSKSGEYILVIGVVVRVLDE